MCGYGYHAAHFGGSQEVESAEREGVYTGASTEPASDYIARSAHPESTSVPACLEDWMGFAHIPCVPFDGGPVGKCRPMAITNEVVNVRFRLDSSGPKSIKLLNEFAFRRSRYVRKSGSR